MCGPDTGCARCQPLHRLSESDGGGRQRQKRAEPYLDVGCFWAFGFAGHVRRVAPCPVLDLEIVWGVHSTGADPVSGWRSVLSPVGWRDPNAPLMGSGAGQPVRAEPGSGRWQLGHRMLSSDPRRSQSKMRSGPASWAPAHADRAPRPEARGAVHSEVTAGVWSSTVRPARGRPPRSSVCF